MLPLRETFPLLSESWGFYFRMGRGESKKQFDPNQNDNVVLYSCWTENCWLYTGRKGSLKLNNLILFLFQVPLGKGKANAANAGFRHILQFVVDYGCLLVHTTEHEVTSSGAWSTWRTSSFMGRHLHPHVPGDSPSKHHESGSILGWRNAISPVNGFQYL